MINFDVLRTASAYFAPFPHAIVPGFVRAERRDDLLRDFPRIAEPGSFPCAALDCGGAFADLIGELEGDDLRAMVAEKLRVELRGHPTMVTARGHCRATDGKIHRDSRGKVVTALIYMNPVWDAAGGRLRLLNGGDDIEDYFAEVAPDFGTLILFRCLENAWHGHKSFAGERRSVQLNWVAGEAYRQRESYRHRVSAAVKKIGRMLSGPRR